MGKKRGVVRVDQFDFRQIQAVLFCQRRYLAAPANDPDVGDFILAGPRACPQHADILTLAKHNTPGACASPPDYLVQHRSEEHTSELQSLMRLSYAVFCL